MKKLQLIFLVLLLIPLFIFAEKRPKNKMKFGKIPIEEFQITRTELDSTADAIILGDFHEYSMDYLPNLGLKNTIEVTRRIKILNKDGIDQMGNIIIRLYDGPGFSDKLSKFKACTYNLVNGKIVESKVDKDNYFIEKDEYWKKYKFAFPDVKEGSILEFTYIIITNRLSFPTYYPQQKFPVLWSELVLRYLDGINFKYFVRGNSPILFQNRESRPDNFIVDTWIFSNVKPLKQESFMGPVINYRTNVNYELQNIAIDGVYYEEITTTWQEIAKDFLKSDHRGKLIDKKRYVDKIIDQIAPEGHQKNTLQLAKDALLAIRSDFKWSGYDRVIPSYYFNDVEKDKKGNSADMNILLMATLRELGVVTRPVMLSTRDNGMLIKSNPSLEDMNYLITSFDIDGERYFVDAATSYSGINELPAKCLNGEALILDMSNSAWVKLSSKQSFSRQVFVQASFDEDLNIKGVAQFKNKGYAAQRERENILDEGSSEEYIQNEIKNAGDFTITNMELNDIDENEKPLSKKYDFVLENELEEGDELIHFSPILFPDFKENPFVKDHREFSIDFQYPYSLYYTYIYTIPEGYVIDEIPQTVRVSNVDQSINLLYSVSANKTTITVMQKFDIKNTIYFPQQYEDIKSFFDYFISQQSKPILLKSIE